MRVEPRACLRRGSLDTMTFLNEVVLRHPDAISFAPGRPIESLFDVRGVLAGIDQWVDHSVAARGSTPETEISALGQYGQTAGIIQDLIAEHLACDMGLRVDPAAIVVTSGCQEAMTIVVLGILDPAVDVLLVADPTYVGIVGIARLANVPVHPVPSGPEGVEPAAVERAIDEVRRSGRRARALYLIPDFDNPLGTCLPLATRRELLAVAARHDLLILEDNPYGAYVYDAGSIPTLKALDPGGVVIYLGSFAKVLFPGLRIGYLVADQTTADEGERVASALTKVKSFTTVNTPPLMQAAVGALLRANGGSLASVVRGKLPRYRAHRDQMLMSLETHFGAARARGDVRWNRPAGGFFMTLELPFAFGAEELGRCSGDYGVIVCPMSFFSILPGREHCIRLSFSYGPEADIEAGIERLASFVNDEIERRAIRT